MKKNKNVDLWTYTKVLVAWIIFNSTIWVYLTYILALLGREQIAETLAEKIVEIVIGTIAFYIIKATIENVSKNKTPKTKTKKETEDSDI